MSIARLLRESIGWLSLAVLCVGVLLPRPAAAAGLQQALAGLSSDDREQLGAAILELGALDVIAKPFDPDWLLRLVDAVLLVDQSERDEYRRRRMAHMQREG